MVAEASVVGLMAVLAARGGECALTGKRGSANVAISAASHTTARAAAAEASQVALADMAMADMAAEASVVALVAAEAGLAARGGECALTGKRASANAAISAASITSARAPPPAQRFIRMPTQPGSLNGLEAGNMGFSSIYGWPLIKTGGFVVVNGGGAYGFFPSSSGYLVHPGNADAIGWFAPPTDGDYTRIYSNHAAHVAVKDNGEVYCFGYRSYGGSPEARSGCPKAGCTSGTCTEAGVDSYYPKPISYIYSSVWDSFCALYVDTTVYCWSTGDKTDEPSPPGTGWLTMTSISACYAALNMDGSIWSERVGGHYTNDCKAKGSVPTAGVWVTIVTTEYAFAALSSTGTIACWGQSGAKAVKDCPTRAGYSAVSAAKENFCAIWSDGSVDCWGTAAYTGKVMPDWTHPLRADTGYVGLYHNYYAWVGVKADGSVKAWGDARYGGELPVGGLGDWTRIYSNRMAFVAMRSDGSLVCWGKSTNGGAATVMDHPPVYNAATSSYEHVEVCPTGVGFKAVYSTHTAWVAVNANDALVHWGSFESSANGGQADEKMEVPYPDDTGYVSVRTGGKGYAAQKADGTVRWFGLRNPGAASQVIRPRKFDLTSEDLAETGWLFCGNSVSSHNEPSAGDPQCGPAPGFPYAGLDNLPSPPPMAPPPALPPSAVALADGSPGSFPRSPLSVVIAAVVAGVIGSNIASSVASFLLLGVPPTLGPIFPVIAIAQRISTNNAIEPYMSDLYQNVTLDLQWVAGIGDMGAFIPQADATAIEMCESRDAVVKEVEVMLNTLVLYSMAMVSVLVMHLLYLLIMYCRAKHAKGIVGRAAQSAGAKRSSTSAYCTNFNPANLWPIPETLTTMQFAAGMVSTSVRVLSAASAAGCCVPYSCWLPILVLLYLVAFILWVVAQLYRFARNYATVVGVPRSEMALVGGPFKVTSQASEAERRSFEAERTRRISLNPFYFGRTSLSSGWASWGFQRNRVVSPQVQPSDCSSPPPSPPPSPPDTADAPASMQRQAMDAAYGLYYVWLGDGRRRREGANLAVLVHSLVVIAVLSACPLCSGSSSVDAQLWVVLALQLLAAVWHLLGRPSPMLCFNVTLAFTWLLEASATVCFLAMAKPTDILSTAQSALDTAAQDLGTSAQAQVMAYFPSPYQPPSPLSPPYPPSMPPPPSPPSPPGSPPSLPPSPPPPTPPPAPPPSPPPPTPPPAPPPSPPPPSPPPPLFPIPCTDQWEAFCSQSEQDASAVVHIINGQNVTFGEFCSTTTECPTTAPDISGEVPGSPGISAEAYGYSVGDIGFGFQLAAFFYASILATLLSLRMWAAIAFRRIKGRQSETKVEHVPKKAPSEAEVTDILREATQVIQRLEIKSLSIDVANRKIALTESLEFQGSKQKGGAGVFKDPASALASCKEVAVALNAINSLLRERGCTQFGLSIEGHASADFGGAKKNSSLRAQSTKHAISQALEAMDSDTPQSGTLVRAVGYGAEKPLAGFNDGGNYAENRRVEINLVPLDDDAVFQKTRTSKWPYCACFRGCARTIAA